MYAGLWVLLISFMLQVMCRPYADPRIGYLETLSLAAVLASLLLGLALALEGLPEAAENGVRTLAALINIAMLCIFAKYAFGEVRERKQASASTRELETTNPMMTDPKWRRTSGISARLDGSVQQQAGPESRH